MRAVDKGTSEKKYNKYGDARKDLASRIGYYCSYCEMGTNNMIEVEHVHPIENGGDELLWDNFLLSCKYCNTIKSNRNASRDGYFWPDLDNTDLLFDYTLDSRVVEVNDSLSNGHQNQAKELINLVGLNRYPGSENAPTEADTRWLLRNDAQTTAMSSYERWSKVKDDLASPYRQHMAEQIAETSLIGFYSIWCKVFEGEVTVLEEIDKIWQKRFHNFKSFRIGGTERIVRPNGQI